MSETKPPIPDEQLLGQYIPLHYHFNMLLDRTRMTPFKEAIAHVVPRNGRVLELGGGTGVLSYFASQQASQVWCVERNPALVQASRRFLSKNQHGDRVQVIQADASTYLPPEPVDVVICEMLHVGLIREKQIQILKSFRERYLAKFGLPLPVFVPDTTLLGVQLVQQDFHFDGYFAPVPMFLPPGEHEQTMCLAEPEIYGTIDYNACYPAEFHWEESVLVHTDGQLNALRFITRNFLAFVLPENRAITWMMNSLILPLPHPLDVSSGDVVSVRLKYQAGCSIEELQESLMAVRRTAAFRPRRAA